MSELYACNFCHTPSYLTICWGCQRGFGDWLFNLFYNKNKRSRSTRSIYALKTIDETNNWNLWQSVSIGIHIIVTNISPNKSPLVIKKSIKKSNSKDWPGFCIGANKRIKPDPFELKKYIDITDIKWENKDTVLRRELIKLGIYIDDLNQYKLNKFAHWILKNKLQLHDHIIDIIDNFHQK